MTPVKKAQGLRYVTRFQCIGSECEDTCCRGWEIPIDEAHYRRLKKTLGATPAGKAEFDASFRPRPPELQHKHTFALLVLKEGKQCTFLEPDLLCRLHRDYGEEALPNLCSAYPRGMAKVGERFELTTTTSCPEAVRQLLLHADGADLIDISPSILPRIEMSMSTPTTTNQPWLGMFDVVRGALYRGVRRREYPVASRLYQLACFAQETFPFFYRACGDEGTFDVDKMQFELECLDNPAILDEQHARFSTETAPSAVTLAMVSRVLEASMRGNPTSPLSKVLAEIGIVTLEDVHPTQLSRRLAEAMPGISAEFHAREEQWLENLLVNMFLREWYTFSPDLVVYLQSLFVRLNLVRFCLYTHPAVAAAHALPDAADRLAAFDRLAVQTVYRLSRAVDHLHELLQHIEKVFVDKKTQTLAYSTLLLQLGPL